MSLFGDVRFALTLCLEIAAIAVLMSGVKVKGKAWLLAFLILAIVTYTGYYTPGLLLRLGVWHVDGFRESAEVLGFVFSVVGLASTIALLVFVIGLLPPPQPGQFTGGGRGPISIPEVLFSFKGRISRSEQWLKAFLVMLPFGILNNVLVYGVKSRGAMVVAGIIGVAGIYPALAVAIKRWHDRDRSAWWLLTPLIPIVGLGFMVWILIETWFLKGTTGPNRFGPDPLQPVDPPPEATAQATGQASPPASAPAPAPAAPPLAAA